MLYTYNMKDKHDNKKNVIEIVFDWIVYWILSKISKENGINVVNYNWWFD